MLLAHKTKCMFACVCVRASDGMHAHARGGAKTLALCCSNNDIRDDSDCDLRDARGVSSIKQYLHCDQLAAIKYPN